MMQHAIIEYLLNALWQVPLLAAGAWCLVRITRPGPRWSHALWLAVLGIAVLVPAHGMSNVNALPLPSAPMLIRRVPAPHASAGNKAGAGQLTEDPRALLPAPAFSAHTITIGPDLMRWLVRLYLGTVILALLRVAEAWRQAWLLAVRARPCSAHGTALASFSRRFGIKTPEVRESAEIASPMIVGSRSPVLLLPENFARFSAEEIRAALGHELAHIQRRDFLLNLVCQLFAAPLVWHPATQLIQQRIRRTREMACDALAAREMESSIRYAKCLLSLAHGLYGAHEWAAMHPGSMGLFGGLFRKSILEERIMELTHTGTSALKAKVRRVAIGGAIMTASLVVATAYHVTPTAAAAPQTNAQVAPAAPPTAKPAAKPSPFESTRSRQPIVREQRSLRVAEDKQLRQQMEIARRQAAVATAFVHSSAFRRQIAEARRQAAEASAKIDSEQFRLRMEDAQRDVEKTREWMSSPEFKQQMEEAQKQAREATAMLNTPEFKHQMEEARRQAFQASEIFRDDQFKMKMDNLQMKMDMMMKGFSPKIDLPPTAP